MIKPVIFSLLFLFITFSELAAQQIPAGSCGIVNVYDNAGNRVRRVYFCNNGTDPYPQKGQPPKSEERLFTTTNADNFSYEPVDALYPNPTSGKFTITFTKSLNNARVVITDNAGKFLTNTKASGIQAEFDLSRYPAGVYYVRIEEGAILIVKKVVVQ
jgi:hypothetical protein